VIRFWDNAVPISGRAASGRIHLFSVIPNGVRDLSLALLIAHLTLRNRDSDCEVPRRRRDSG